MKKVEAGFYLTLMVCCAVYIYSAFSLRIGSFSEPGTGLIPLLLGTTGFVLSSVLFLAAIRNPKQAQSDEEKNQPSPFSNKKMMMFLATLVLFFSLFQKVDFLILTFGLILTLAKIFDLEGWKKPIALAVTFVAAVYVIFIWGFEVTF